ncbi:peptide deformylase [Cellulomonas sp. PhB143]|uniref:peptide deformylase n=1 Tax=Cellulomonas sp. PhB143 TaxID=2485186 RepID=UPI000F48920B|nr:peptide deformylase [Cellulomonas sp. PhB143]ROS76814.1 peptide deformylase [Cellulomonas sp. PhB143]
MTSPGPAAGPRQPWAGPGTGTVDAGLRDAVARFLEANPDGLLPIVHAGHPVLRAVATPYTGQLGDLLPDLLTAMHATMVDAPGVGLAAPQVGIGLAVAVVRDPGPSDPDDPHERVAVPHRTLVNPSYAPASDATRSFYEGCLSVPGWHAVRTRHHAVRLTGQDESGESLDEVLTGWPARIVQHETDHLRGEIYLDRAEPRSLSDDENMARFWAQEADPSSAAKILGFSIP